MEFLAKILNIASWGVVAYIGWLILDACISHYAKKYGKGGKK
jgi:hypothetical protein